VRTNLSKPLAAALWLISLASTLALAADGPGASVGQIKLTSGLTARFEYHFDRNAIRESRRIGNSLVALTRSGNLVRFDLTTRKPNLEMFSTSPATCIGLGEGDALLVGFEDGRICRSDPTTLLLTEVAKLEGKPQWIGFVAGAGEKPGGIIAVLERMKPAEDAANRPPVRFSVVHDTGSGKDIAIDRYATAILLDSKRRVWLGGDMGEWGGWCSCVDLATGEARKIDGTEPGPQGLPWWSGIYGFVQLHDGQVWAHGGTMHMGVSSAFICRVDGAKTVELMRGDNKAARRAAMEEKPPPKPDRPWLPITHILDERDGSLLVFSYNDLFRAEPGMKRWTKVREIRIRYRGGRPDAMGTYPAMIAVHPLDTKATRLICATAFEGYVLIEPGKTSMLKLPGQLEAEDVTRIVNTAEGTIFSTASDADSPWRFRDGAWSIAKLTPPFPPELKGPGEGRPAEQKWDRSHLLVGPGGAITTVNADTRGTRMTARWRGIRVEVLGRVDSGLDPSACFMTPDGSLWNAEDGLLYRFSGRGEWGDPDPRPEHSPGSPRDVGRNLRSVNEAGPPWIILDRDKSRLLSLVDGPKVEAPKLRAIDLVEDGLPYKVRDAIPWKPGELLLATDGGLRRYEVATGKIQPPPVPEPERRVDLLCRDGLGRVWMAGEGVWIVDPDGKRLHDGEAIPMIGGGKVVAIAADPKRRDGVILSLGSRGVVFVQVAPTP
jgi:hypothetical protein